MIYKKITFQYVMNTNKKYCLTNDVYVVSNNNCIITNPSFNTNK